MENYITDSLVVESQNPPTMRERIDSLTIDHTTRYIHNIFNKTVNQVLEKGKGILWKIPTGGAKTSAGIIKSISTLYKEHSDRKIVHIVTGPYKSLENTNKVSLENEGVKCYTRDEFRNQQISSNQITITANWQSLILDDNFIRIGDSESFIEKINWYKSKGYQIVIYIDECHLFNKDTAPKVREFLSHLDTDSITMFLYSATPPNWAPNLVQETVDIEDVVKLPFVKDGLKFHKIEDSYRRIYSTFEALKKFEKEYENLGLEVTPKVMFVLPTDSQRLKKEDEDVLNLIHQICDKFGLDPMDSIYHLDIEGQKRNSETIQNVKDLDDPKYNHIKIIMTKQAGLTGMSVHSLEVGCSLKRNPFDVVWFTQFIGRFVRNIDFSAKSLLPIVFIPEGQSTENFTGFDGKIKNNLLRLIDFQDKQFPHSYHQINKQYINSLSELFKSNIGQFVNNLVGTGTHHSKEWIAEQKMTDFLSLQTIEGKEIQGHLTHHVKVNRVSSLFKKFGLNHNDYMIELKKLMKKKFGNVKMSEIFNILSFDQNIDLLQKTLDNYQKNWESSDNYIYTAKVFKESKELPKELITTKSSYYQSCPCDIFDGWVSYDTDGEKITHTLLRRKGFKIFRNEMMISISYKKGDELRLYYPDFVGFDKQGNLVAIDRKGRTLLKEQLDDLSEKHKAATELGYIHYIVTEVNDNSIFYTQEMDPFIPYGQSTDNWKTF